MVLDYGMSKTASPFSFPVSPALAAKLAKLGSPATPTWCLHLPLRWEDETRITPIRDLLPGESRPGTGRGREASVAYRPRRMLTVTVEDAGGVLGIRFLNFYPSQLKLFQPGQSLSLQRRSAWRISGAGDGASALRQGR